MAQVSFCFPWELGSPRHGRWCADTYTPLPTLHVSLLPTPADVMATIWPREAAVARNEDYDLARRRKFPDGFIYFRYIIDLYMDADLPLNERVKLTAAVLNTLWDERFPAIAACSYEKRLPLGGGYQNRSVPWPR